MNETNYLAKQRPLTATEAIMKQPDRKPQFLIATDELQEAVKELEICAQEVANKLAPFSRPANHNDLCGTEKAESGYPPAIEKVFQLQARVSAETRRLREMMERCEL